MVQYELHYRGSHCSNSRASPHEHLSGTLLLIWLDIPPRLRVLGLGWGLSGSGMFGLYRGVTVDTKNPARTYSNY